MDYKTSILTSFVDPPNEYCDRRNLLQQRRGSTRESEHHEAPPTTPYSKLRTIQKYCSSLSEDDIIAACSDPRKQRPGEERYCKNVIKLNEVVVVKYGSGVREEEARNIQRAYEIIDQNVVRTPYMFRYFRRAHTGYVLMEFIDGAVAELVDDSLALDAMDSILGYFGSITSTTRGPLGGGWSRGLLCEDQDAHFHGDVLIMEAWYNRRLSTPASLDFAADTLVFCHLDLSRRNVLLSPEGSKPPAVVDWMSAGFYPRSFESYMLSLQHNLVADDFYQTLLERQTILPATRQQINLISEAWSNAKRHFFSPEETEIPQYDYSKYAAAIAELPWLPLPIPPAEATCSSG